MLQTTFLGKVCFKLWETVLIVFTYQIYCVTLYKSTSAEISEVGLACSGSDLVHWIRLSFLIWCFCFLMIIVFSFSSS